MKMEEYLTTMKAFSDNLTLAGSPISLSDLITQILSGLDAEYTLIVVQLSDKESLSWIELQTTLLTFESRLEQLNTYQSGDINLSQATAHIAINRPENKSSNFSYGRGQSRPPNNNNSKGSRGRFHGRGGISNGSKPTCQICNKIGHTASIFWNRFDQNFMGNTSTQFDQHKNQSANAFIASPETLEDPSWYADTGASHHVTNDLGNLHQKQDYSGKNFLVVGNGSKLDISHIGNLQLPTQQKDLLLNNVLCGPNITKNLLSKSQLVADNKVNVEFNSFGCFVKDKLTGLVMLQGKLEDGLYKLEIVSTSNQSNVTKSKQHSQKFPTRILVAF
ncbi:hypothetical protein Pint_34054 [Pistacia integerrima]|uniref:Uncharacterized protein n=1 Tax=Pistacia integerrima TaxID=434235 RepID=A0ACC0X8P4_9ROSI|nr:hypothetical protein Pint_34054 [Pistacia integerrima]